MNFNLQLKIYKARKQRSTFYDYMEYKDSVDLYSASEDKDTLAYNSYDPRNRGWVYGKREYDKSQLHIMYSVIEWRNQLDKFKKMKYLYNLNAISRQS